MSREQQRVDAVQNQRKQLTLTNKSWTTKKITETQLMLDKLCFERLCGEDEGEAATERKTFSSHNELVFQTQLHLLPRHIFLN